MGEREFVALMAALTAGTALGIDVMLPALGEIRGRGAGGGFAMIVGSLPASLTNRFLPDSVTPLSLGYLGYSALAAACILWAGRQRRAMTGAPAG